MASKKSKSFKKLDAAFKGVKTPKKKKIKKGSSTIGGAVTGPGGA